MLDFANPYLLFLLLAIPVLMVLYWLSRIALKRKIKRFGRPAIVTRLMPDVSRYKPAIKITLRLIALAAIIIVLARPRHGETEDTVDVDGSEIVIAFDLSRSMLAPATDMPNSASRLDRSRMLLEKLVSSLSNDKIGLVTFAGNAKMLMPITADRRMIQLALQNDLTPGSMSTQGTSIAAAIEMSTLAFPGLRGNDSDKEGDKDKSKDIPAHRAIILITDAEDHEGAAIERAKQAAGRDIQIDVIGVGTAAGGKIPDGKDGKYFLDPETGEEVITCLNDQAARQVAEAGGGVYVNAADPDALAKLQESLDKLEKTELKSVTYKMSAEQFPLFAWIALAFLIIDLAVVERKTSWLKGVNFFTRNRLRHKPQPSKANKS